MLCFCLPTAYIFDTTLQYRCGSTLTTLWCGCGCFFFGFFFIRPQTRLIKTIQDHKANHEDLRAKSKELLKWWKAEAKWKFLPDIGNKLINGDFVKQLNLHKEQLTAHLTQMPAYQRHRFSVLASSPHVRAHLQQHFLLLCGGFSYK